LQEGCKHSVLLLIGRLLESWIAPAHLLDLRARVRCRDALVHQRTECQQRMLAVLVHHGARTRAICSGLPTASGSPR
jgi:hypothetical protein